MRSEFQDQGRLNDLTSIVLDNIEDIYEFFGCEYHKGSKILFSNCFIHGGDNTQALNLYYNADYRIHYKCRTHVCEGHFGSSLLSMIRGGLSHLKYNWKTPGDKEVDLNETIEFLLDKFKLNFNKLKNQQTNIYGNHQFANLIRNLEEDDVLGTIDRDFYRSKVEIPSTYFMRERNYPIELLDDYDIGDCHTYKKPMYNRAVIPIYDQYGDKIVGVTGRSVFNECKKCHEYHDPNKECHFFPKWRNNKGLDKEKLLYNYWKAKKHIEKCNVAILVESPGNVLRLEESGIRISLGMFGTVLSKHQKKLLDKSGALTVIIIPDNDEPGIQGANIIKQNLEKAYNVVIIDNLPAEDVGNMTVDQINTYIKPYVDNEKESYS